MHVLPTAPSPTTVTLSGRMMARYYNIAETITIKEEKIRQLSVVDHRQNLHDHTTKLSLCVVIVVCRLKIFFISGADKMTPELELVLYL